ncbi:hypothetical protein CLU84_1783 [Comamonas sp. 26]|nr:hypothetical protein CLU84_1783 [Comamonas sp. 26]
MFLLSLSCMIKFYIQPTCIISLDSVLRLRNNADLAQKPLLLNRNKTLSL